jgi:hypothetical protein
MFLKIHSFLPSSPSLLQDKSAMLHCYGTKGKLFGYGTKRSKEKLLWLGYKKTIKDQGNNFLLCNFILPVV